MPINQLSTANTFQEWLTTTSTLVAFANNLSDNTAGGFIANSSIFVEGTNASLNVRTLANINTLRANTGNIGICYIGGVDKKMNAKDTRTEAQKKSLLTLIRTYKERYPGIIIRGHRDWPGTKKACPSFDVGAWLKETGDL